MTQPNTGPTKLETLLGGTELVVAKLDGSAEHVRVIQLPIKLFPYYSANLNNEPRAVELFCEKPEGWSELLTNESIEAVITEGERLNADFFVRWQARQRKRAEALPKAGAEEATKMLDELSRKNPALLESLLKTAMTPSPPPSPVLLAAPVSVLRKPAASP